MRKLRTVVILLITALVFYSSSSVAADFDAELLDIQHQWAKANYKMEGDAKENALLALLGKCAAFNDRNPNRAEAIIWNGIVNSTYAGAKGGLGALKYAKAARKDFERALKLAPDALSGSAYTSLGTLYYKVPGFPIGFGNKKKAKEHLLKALEINPAGIDANYFYGDYLISTKKYSEAIPVLKKALNAEARPNRPLADEGRRKEVSTALALARAKIK